MIHGHLADVPHAFCFEVSPEPAERKAVLTERARVEFLLPRGQILLDALCEGWTDVRVGPGFRHQRGAERFGLLQVG
jgi:hypothetical protein